MNQTNSKFAFLYVKSYMKILLLLCGIPGSGKSTFATTLHQTLLSLNVFDTINIISFDDFIVDRLSWNETSFRQGREQAFFMLHEQIRLLASNHENDDITRSLIIIDDLNYLKSMRRELYVIGRENRWSSVVVWVNTTVNVAIERNSRRTGDKIVDESAIHKINKDFELPDKSHSVVDKCWYMIDGSESFSSEVDKLISTIPQWFDHHKVFMEVCAKFEYDRSHSQEEHIMNPKQQLDISSKKIVSMIVNRAKNIDNTILTAEVKHMIISSLATSLAKKRAHLLATFHSIDVSNNYMQNTLQIFSVDCEEEFEMLLAHGSI